MIPAQHAIECADIVTSSDDYARRFAGDIGSWLLEVQSAIAKKMLSEHHFMTALDVGGGHGQLVQPLRELGMKVTVLGSDASCSQQIQKALADQLCTFATGSLTDIPFADRSFELATCIRFISHCEEWDALIATLCRVASRGVLIDYPPLLSSNLLTPITFRIKKLIEGNTRPFSIFLHQEIEREFAKHGFILASRSGQFLFPMAIHRLVKSRKFSDTMERLASQVHARDAFGSPTLALFVREK